MACEAHVGDTGTILECTIVDCQDPPQIIDISSATVTKDITIRAPDYSKSTKSGVFKTDGTDGIVQYVILGTDLTAEGTWSIQAKVLLSDGEWYSEIDTFPVKGNL